MKPWIMHRADPFACNGKNGKFYFIATAPKYDCIALRESDSL